MYEPAWYRALQELGCHVEMFDCHQFTLPGLLGRIERRILAGPSVARLRRSLIEQVTRGHYAVVLLYQGHYIDLETVERLRPHALIVGYHNDDPFGEGSKMLRYRHFRHALPGYHGIHVYRPVNVPEALAAGVPRVGVLMPAFMPWMDYPRSLTTAQRQQFHSDLLFAGHCEPDHRSACLQAAAAAGFKLRVHGDAKSWALFAPAPLLQQIGPIRHITGDDYRRAIAAAAISLCFFSKKNRDQYTRRVFEITACAGFLLAERTDAMLELFPEGSCAEYFSSVEEFIDKARFYTSSEQARNKIAAAGHARVHASGHDLHSRLRQWLADVELWRREQLG